MARVTDKEKKFSQFPNPVSLIHDENIKLYSHFFHEFKFRYDNDEFGNCFL